MFIFNIEEPHCQDFRTGTHTLPSLVTMSLFPPFLFLSLAAAVCHTMGIREISPCRTSLTPEWRINCSPPEARIRRISTPLSSDRARFMKNKPRNLFYRFCGFQENFSDTEKLKIIPVPLLTLKVFRCALNFTSGSPTKNRKQADFQIVQITQLLGYQQDSSAVLTFQVGQKKW